MALLAASSVLKPSKNSPVSCRFVFSSRCWWYCCAPAVSPVCSLTKRKHTHAPTWGCRQTQTCQNTLIRQTLQRVSKRGEAKAKVSENVAPASSTRRSEAIQTLLVAGGAQQDTASAMSSSLTHLPFASHTSAHRQTDTHTQTRCCSVVERRHE